MGPHERLPPAPAGYAVATIALPLGDISSEQTRRLAEVARRYVGDTVRTTVEQNIVLRWVAEATSPPSTPTWWRSTWPPPGPGRSST